MNLGDYTIWRDTIGAEGSNLAADGDGNGVVDGGDYALWRQNVGGPSAARQLATLPQTVPSHRQC